MISESKIILNGHSQEPGINIMRAKKDSIKNISTLKIDNGIMTDNSKKSFENQKSYFEQIFESRSDAILILNDRNEIININKGFEKMFHFSIDEVSGKLPSDIIVPDNLI